MESKRIRYIVHGEREGVTPTTIIPKTEDRRVIGVAKKKI